MIDNITETKVFGIGTRVVHPSYGAGCIIKSSKIAYDVCFMKHGIKPVSKTYKEWEIVEAIAAKSEWSFNKIERQIIRVMTYYNGLDQKPQIGAKWRNAKMIMIPNNGGTQKELQTEVLFNKIILVRDRLRVMEQRINSSKNLSNDEKVNLEAYLTRIYGSLTSFNFLFASKEDYFVGEKKS